MSSGEPDVWSCVPPLAKNPMNYISLLGLAARRLTAKIMHLVIVRGHGATMMCPNPTSDPLLQLVSPPVPNLSITGLTLFFCLF